MVLSIHCNTVSARFSGGDGTVDNCGVSDRDRRLSRSQADGAVENSIAIDKFRRHTLCQGHCVR